MNLFTHLGCIGLHHLFAYVYATAYIMFVCTICFRYVQIIETRYDLPYYFVKKPEAFVRSHLCGVSSTRSKVPGLSPDKSCVNTSVQLFQHLTFGCN